MLSRNGIPASFDKSGPKNKIIKNYLCPFQVCCFLLLVACTDMYTKQHTIRTQI